MTELPTSKLYEYIPTGSIWLYDEGTGAASCIKVGTQHPGGDEIAALGTVRWNFKNAKAIRPWHGEITISG